MVARTNAEGEPDGGRDGRVLRGARNHEAIVTAVYDLVREHHLPPSVEAIAERAGVGTRTVFRQFEDLDGLYRSMGERVLQEIVPLVTMSAPTGYLEADLAALVGRRARIFEHVAPFRRAARLVRHESAFLQEQDALTTKLLRAGLTAVVGSHLAAATDEGSTLEALDALLSFEAWDRLRVQQKLSVKRAEQVVIAAAAALVRAAAADGRPRKRHP